MSYNIISLNNSILILINKLLSYKIIPYSIPVIFECIFKIFTSYREPKPNILLGRKCPREDPSEGDNVVNRICLA